MAMAVWSGWVLCLWVANRMSRLAPVSTDPLLLSSMRSHAQLDAVTPASMMAGMPHIVCRFLRRAANTLDCLRGVSGNFV